MVENWADWARQQQGALACGDPCDPMQWWIRRTVHLDLVSGGQTKRVVAGNGGVCGIPVVPMCAADSWLETTQGAEQVL